MQTHSEVMRSRFAKTPSGAAEIRSRAHTLSRAARDLLFIIDGSRTASAWAVLIHGTTDADINHLIEKEFIATGPAQASARVLTLADAIATLSYDQLYGLLTSQGPRRLGLIKGCKLILATERCAGLPEMQKLASQFYTMVRNAQGDAEAQRMYTALGVAG